MYPPYDVFSSMSSAVFAPRAVDKMLTAQERAGEHNFRKNFTRRELEAWPAGRQIRGQDFPPCEQSPCSPPCSFSPAPLSPWFTLFVLLLFLG